LDRRHGLSNVHVQKASRGSRRLSEEEQQKLINRYTRRNQELVTNQEWKALDKKDKKDLKKGGGAVTTPAKAPSNGSTGKRDAPVPAPSSGSAPGSAPATEEISIGAKSDKREDSNGLLSKSGKATGPSGGLCSKRLELAWESNKAANNTLQVNSPEEFTERCEFDTDPDFYPNLSCPFFFDPDEGFLDTENKLVNFIGNETIAKAFYDFQLYCQCQQAFELKCTSKIPHGPPTAEIDFGYGDVLVPSYSEYIPASSPEVRAEYCAFGGIWNGDFDLENFYDLSADVQDCGCFWLYQAKEMVGTCPGVDLGFNYTVP
jgi:hypothetical protein